MPAKVVCEISGKEFEVSDLEIGLREKFGLDLPKVAPKYRVRELGAFWQHWNLHHRKCDKSGENIISVFRPDCEYPVWKRELWVNEANPPGAQVDFSTDVFPQMWEFFKKSPLPHRTGAHLQNCEYTDDSWYGKNCYLCHSFAHVEDMTYCYRMVNSKDCIYSVFSSKCERCCDVVNCDSCFNLVYGLNCRSCIDSAFLYDCRNCTDCMFCSNLRGKKYCFENQQLSKEEYERKRAEWDLRSRKKFNEAEQKFRKMLAEQSWHRALINDLCEDVDGNYNNGSRDCVSCYFTQENEQCVNSFRTFIGKTLLDFHGQTAEFSHTTILAQDKCYAVNFSSQISNSKYMDYCAFCLNCQYCFGCCGLVGKKYYIFNKQYSEEEYHKVRAKLIEHMKSTGEWGRFFPGYFAQNPYDESWSSFYFPLIREEQEAAGFKWMPPAERRGVEHVDASLVPDDSADFDESVFEKVFWDEDFDRPFRIRKEDVEICKKLKIPLPNRYYINRMQENFRYLPFEGELREVKCGKCDRKVKTGWREDFDGRILCEECYLGEIA